MVRTFRPHPPRHQSARASRQGLPDRTRGIGQNRWLQESHNEEGAKKEGTDSSHQKLLLKRSVNVVFLDHGGYYRINSYYMSEDTIDDISFGMNSEWKYESVRQEVYLAQQNLACKLRTRESYRAAIRLCAITRDLVLWFLKDWQSDSALSINAGNVRESVDASVDLFVTAQSESPLSEHEIKHIEKMIENTTIRANICRVLGEPGSDDDKYHNALAQYDNSTRNEKPDLALSF